MNRRAFSPYLLASFLLHGTAALLMMLNWRGERDLKLGAVVPVNIVANAPTTDLAPAVQAPEEQTAQAEDPVPDAPPEAVPPTPAPTPTPPKPTTPPKPAPPKPAPTPAKPTPSKPPAKPAEKAFDLDALAASLKGGKPSAAAKGPARPATAPQARPALGAGEQAAAVTGLSDEITRRWNPNCDVDGGRDVKLIVRFAIGPSGQVVGSPRPELRSASGPVAQAASERAVRAVIAASPFRKLPSQLYGQSFAVNFDANKACSS